MTLRTPGRLVLLTVALLLAGGLTALPASAALITFVVTGTGSGSIDGNPFTDAAFTITATGDTANRITIFGDPLVDPLQVVGYTIDHDAASISISGVGDFAFVTGTRTFVVNIVAPQVGFSRDDSSGSADLYDGPRDPIFAGWDMLESIGPIAGTIRLFQWGDSSSPHPVLTVGGQLIFNSANTSGFFQAVVPEPSCPALLGIGGIAVIASRRRA